MNYKSILKHYLQFTKKRLPMVIILLVSYGIASISSSLSVPFVYKSIIDVISINGADVASELTRLFVIMIAMFVLITLFYRIGDYMLIKFLNNTLKELNDYVLEKLQQHSYTFFSNAFSGGLVAKSNRFVDAFDTLFSQFVWHIWLDGIMLVGSIVVLWYQSWILGVIFLVWFLVFLVIIKFLLKYQVPKNLKLSEYDSHNTARFSDIISNILTVKTFATERRELLRYKEVTKKESEVRDVAWMQDGFWNPTFQGIYVNTFEVILIGVAVLLWFKGFITPGTIVLVQIYVISTFDIVWRIGKNFIKISSALSNADEMVQILDKGLDVNDTPDAKPFVIDRGEIVFKDVDFSYQKGGQVFSKLDLRVKAGERLSLVGHSGAGKSTVLKLLLRFLDVNSGEITIDGQDISKVKQEDLRNAIAYVPQDTALFHRSLKENISYGKPEATMEEIIEVAKKAHAHEFIDALPEKYDSLVGERGIKLSGGERQRIAIARAMLKNAPIIVLDEATSALDSESEAVIQDAFKELMEGKTTIVIAHRLSTIKNMDRIVVFDKGKIVESGTHNTLTKKKGIYAKLWDRQVGGFILE